MQKIEEGKKKKPSHSYLILRNIDWVLRCKLKGEDDSCKAFFFFFPGGMEGKMKDVYCHLTGRVGGWGRGLRGSPTG